jgi:tetratricopeptide (TPR) repeat protein
LTPLELREIAAREIPTGSGFISESDLTTILFGSKGIPGVFKGAVNLVVAEKFPAERAVELILSAFREGVIEEHLGVEQLTVLRALQISGGILPIKIICKLLGAHNILCRRTLRRLELYGLIQIDGENARLREPGTIIAGKIPPESLKEYARQISRLLVEHPSYTFKVKALQILASHCLTHDASRLVSERIKLGSSWPLCCIERYLTALNHLLGCRNLTPNERALFSVEKILFDHSFSGNYDKVSKLLEKHLKYLVYDSALYARLSALYAGFLCLSGRLEKALKWLKIAREHMMHSPRRYFNAISGVLYSTETIVYFVNNELEKALKAAWNEAEIALRQGDTTDYIISLTHYASIQLYALKIGELKNTLKELIELKNIISPQLARYIDIFLEYVDAAMKILDHKLFDALEVIDRNLREREITRLESDFIILKIVVLSALGRIEEARNLIEKVLRSELATTAMERNLVKTLQGVRGVKLVPLYEKFRRIALHEADERRE